MIKVKDGQRYDLVLAHGTAEEAISGKVRIFDQEGRTCYEVITDEVEAIANVDGKPEKRYLTVGFLPEHVLKATVR